MYETQCEITITVSLACRHLVSKFDPSQSLRKMYSYMHIMKSNAGADVAMSDSVSNLVLEPLCCPTSDVELSSSVPVPSRSTVIATSGVGETDGLPDEVGCGVFVGDKEGRSDEVGSEVLGDVLG